MNLGIELWLFAEESCERIAPAEIAFKLAESISHPEDSDLWERVDAKGACSRDTQWPVHRGFVLVRQSEGLLKQVRG